MLSVRDRALRDRLADLGVELVLCKNGPSGTIEEGGALCAMQSEIFMIGDGRRGAASGRTISRHERVAATVEIAGRARRLGRLRRSR